MMYLRFMIVLTLLSSMIGLALPSDPQQRMAKGSKKNPSSSSQQQEETVIPVEVMVPQKMPMEKLQERVTKIVLDILNDNKRRGLAVSLTPTFIGPKKPRYSVHTTDTTETECTPDFTAAAVICYAAKVTIGSNGKIAAALSKLKDLLARGIDQPDIYVTGGNKQGIRATPVKITNETPYEAVSGFVDYNDWKCRDDVYRVAAGQTWSATRRGLCRVYDITANLALSPGGDPLECKLGWYSQGTRLFQFYIVMNGADKCCLLDSEDYVTSPKCPPAV